MILWLNGTFGAGKTTTACELAELVPQARLFDAEQVGYMLAHVPDLPDLGDFQHWPPWRRLVVETASRLLDYVGGVLVVPQSVLVRQYWEEISTGLAEAGIAVRQYVLHTDSGTLRQRIVDDSSPARDWRLRRLDDYDEVPASWLGEAAQLVDTTHREPREVARVVAADAGALRDAPPHGGRKPRLP